MLRKTAQKLMQMGSTSEILKVVKKSGKITAHTMAAAAAFEGVRGYIETTSTYGCDPLWVAEKAMHGAVVGAKLGGGLSVAHYCFVKFPKASVNLAATTTAVTSIAIAALNSKNKKK